MSNIHEEPRTLRTVADFMALPPGQMPECLRAFRQWLHVQAGTEVAPYAPAEFVWVPPALPAPQPLTPLTEIGRLGLRPGALQQFRRMNIYVLEDFSAVSPAEMGRLVNVGGTTVARIRDMLRSVGLDFRADEPPPQRRPRPGPVAGPSEPANFGDASSLAGLGLKSQTLGKLVLHGVFSVGELRELTPAQLAALLTVRRRQEVFRLLRTRGLDLRCAPADLELWRHGLLHLRELARPSAQDSVLALEPWFGAAPMAKALAAGIASVGQLQALAAAGSARPKVPGLGPYTWSRIRHFFQGKQPSASAPAP